LTAAAPADLLRALQRAIDDYQPVFEKLREARTLSEYVARRGERADEEILTEPILRAIIERVLGFPKGRYLEVLLPKDVAAFNAFVASRGHEVERVLREGCELVEKVERLVCALYDVPGDLVTRIVEHAEARAARSHARELLGEE
jgi:hypothetical protein